MEEIPENVMNINRTQKNGLMEIQSFFIWIFDHYVNSLVALKSFT